LTKSSSKGRRYGVYRDHTVEPEIGTIRDGEGEYIGDDAADCAYCGLEISGNEDGWYHTEGE
jgi:hypothetical protein